jgi:hypothetical protein
MEWGDWQSSSLFWLNRVKALCWVTNHSSLSSSTWPLKLSGSKSTPDALGIRIKNRTAIAIECESIMVICEVEGEIFFPPISTRKTARSRVGGDGNVSDGWGVDFNAATKGVGTFLITHLHNIKTPLRERVEELSPLWSSSKAISV